ncbi:putative trissin-like, partial [Homarus americanus]
SSSARRTLQKSGQRYHHRRPRQSSSGQAQDVLVETESHTHTQVTSSGKVHSGVVELVIPVQDMNSLAIFFGVNEADSMALEGLLKPDVSGTKDSHLSQILHLLSRALAESKTDPAFYKDPPSLSSVLSPLVQESTEEETDDTSDLLPSSGGDSDDPPLDNVIYLAFKRPSPSLNQLQHQNLHQRYTPSPTSIKI